MNKRLKKTGTFLRQTWLWTLLLVLLLVLLVWFAGPSLAVNDFKFWETPTSRLLTISTLFLAWGLAMVFVSWRAGVRKLAVEASDGGHKRVLEDEQIDIEHRALKARFKLALNTLKYSNLYGGQSERWRNDLPWYLVIGPQGGGKTSLLECSALEFPINRIDDDRPPDSDGARHCHWYFADQGVLLDTAGRYLTQADACVDNSAWNSLLDLLRKRRRNRPLNGVLVTIPVQALLAENQALLRPLTEQVRARLQEVRQRLHVDLPVYLVLTKADGLPGFNEFFAQLSRAESDQVLGASLHKDLYGGDLTWVRTEFEALLQRLGSQVVMRMHQERDPLCRGLVFDFPSRLSLIGAGLCEFVDQAFGGNRFQRTSHLRGFYLTCAPAANQSLDQAEAGGNAGGAVRPRFIHDLFSRVVFPEADLAGLDTRERRRIHWGQRSLYAGALTVLIVSGLLWANAFSANHARLENLRLLAQFWKPPLPDDPKGVLASLDNREAATRVFAEKDAISYRERGGLYQGERLSALVRGVYEKELQAQLLPQVATLLEGQIRASMKDRERLLNSLRAYLMLNMTEHRDAPWLKDWVASGWSLGFAGDTAMQNGLNAHFEYLLKQPFTYPLNEQLVKQARQVLRSESLASIAYRMLREQAHDLPQYRFSQHLGPQGAMFGGADYVIPGFYTRQGYQQYFSVQGAALVAGVLRDNWILGEGSDLSGKDLQRLMVELEQLYFRDYATHWNEAIGRLTLPPVNSAAEGAEHLGGLTSANSPFMQLLLQVRDNTRFPRLDEGVVESAGAILGMGDKGSKLGNLATAVAAKAADIKKPLPENARKSLQRRFEPLHRLLDENDGPAADLIPVIGALNDLQLQLASLARASAPEQAAFDMAKLRMSGQRDAFSHLRNVSGRLPRPVSGWFSGLAEDAWKLVLSDAYQYLNQRYQAELYSIYGKTISKRYPFNAHGTSDVSISDFRDFFKAQGIADRFFETYLQPFVKGDPGSYRLRSIDGHALPISRVYLEQMAAAHGIRQSFFSINPVEPQIQFKLEPYTLDPAVSRSEFRFAGQLVEYRHGPIVPTSFQWPTDAEDGRTSLVMDRMAGRPIGIEKNTGPWSLFRLFDLMQTEYLSGRDVLVLKADVGGLRANYLLTGVGPSNPFDLSLLRTFRLPMQL